MSNLPSIAELHDELIRAMGACLIKIQFFELYASGCLLVMFPDKKFAADDLMSGDSSRRGPTLAALLERMRKVMPFETSFEMRLSSFVENRNIFIHRFFMPDLGRSGIDREAALYAKLRFLLDLMNEADALKPIFSGFYSLLHKAQFMKGEIEHPDEIDVYAVEIEKYEEFFVQALQRTKKA